MNENTDEENTKVEKKREPYIQIHALLPILSFYVPRDIYYYLSSYLQTTKKENGHDNNTWRYQPKQWKNQEQEGEDCNPNNHKMNQIRP